MWLRSQRVLLLARGSAMAHIGEEAPEQQPDQSQQGESSLERKHAAMLERLAANQDARLQQSAVRRAVSAAETSPLESVQQFLQLFSESRQQVETKLASLRERKSSLSSEEDKSSFKLGLENLALDLSNMEKLVAEKSYFLPAYEVRASQSAIAKLREDIEAVNDELLPKKKFSFRSKAGKSGRGTNKKEDEMLRSMPSMQDGKQTRHELVLSERSMLKTIEGIRDAHANVIVRDFKDHVDGEYTLSNLSNCKVYLRGKLRALFIHKLKNSHVYAGPVTGSVLIEEVENCVLMLASHQIRIHSVKFTDFYLRLRSRPIVEYTSKVRFAPYDFGYDGIQDDLQAANLSEETGMWANVDDFGWLKAVHSPNWSILPEHERLPHVDGHVDNYCLS